MVISVEDLSASVWLWHQDGDRWAVDKVITIPAEPADADDLPPALKPFGAVPPLVSDIDLSVDDHWLYVSCWGTGELKQFDVSDPFHPRETASVRLGGVVRREPHPADPELPLAGGPQMIEISRDGRRVYATNSLYAAWDEVFYPDGVGAWMAKLDADISAGGLVPDAGFFPHGDEFRGLRVHQTRLQGGDASSDSYCFTSESSARANALSPADPDGELIRRHVVALRAADLDGGLGAAVLVREPQRRVVGQVASPPLEHRPDHRHEVDAGIGEHVLVAAALPWLLVRPALEQSGLDELVQPRGRRGFGDTDSPPEVVEPGGAVVGLAHDQHRRLGAQQRHGLLDRALAHRRPGIAIGEPRPAALSWNSPYL